jgi:uncharacterized protein YrzB (UPF0473 family)
MDKIKVYDEAGQEVEKEVVLLFEFKEKNYILFKDIEGDVKKIYASYFYADEMEDDVITLHNDLTEEEYTLLEGVYKEGRDKYDREK